jgi:acyl-CoA synthetase (AMP-forming)/AMP-acid ligase II
MNALGMVKFVIAAGATMVLLPQFNARHYVEAIGRFRVTWLSSVPTMLALALREHAALARTDMSSVEIVRTGSAPITQSLIDEIKRTFPWATLAIGYGTTESGPVVWGASWFTEVGSRNRLAASGRRRASRGTQWHRRDGRRTVDSHPCQHGGISQSSGKNPTGFDE